MSAYLRPTAAIAAEALLPADPGLAMRLAQELTESPLMSNHHHGLWGYSGSTAAGRQLTIQATGIGGPSAAAVLAELAEHGVRRAIRIGVATALAPAMVGEPVIVGGALCEDGTSRAHGAIGELATDGALTARLSTEARREPATIASTDVRVEPLSALAERLRDAGAVAADLETAALIAVAEASGVEIAACVLACSAVAPTGERRDNALLELGRFCVGALSRAEALADLG